MENTQLQLIDIQRLQFSDKDTAEAEMLAFLQMHEDPAISSVELNPKRESLNSINGFLRYENGDRLFFKTHVEESEKLGEYYNAEALERAGYPVIEARRVTGRVGKQIALYEIVELPTLFDLVGSEEFGIQGESSARLMEEQIRLDKTVFEIYLRSLQDSTAEEHSEAPIHQLFSHRLADDGRLGEYYLGKHVVLEPAESGIDLNRLSFDELAEKHWTINGVRYHQPLTEIIARSRKLLAPQAGPSIVGHGDAHNGNIFVDWSKERGCFSFFDPAFAGRHDPLLDLVKPLFHNVFARWMYYPQEVLGELSLSFALQGNEVLVDHSFVPSSIRLEFLKSRRENLLLPLLETLRGHGMLRDDWQDYLRSALFCCPFLTVNLFAPHVANGTLSERYTPTIRLLGLAIAVQFGSTGESATDDLSQAIASIFTETK